MKMEGAVKPFCTKEAVKQNILCICVSRPFLGEHEIIAEHENSHYFHD